MAYSLDLRQKVVNYVENGGSITKAAAIFKVGRATIYRWLGREDLRPTQVKHRQRKLDWEALKKDVEKNPEARLVERARTFRRQTECHLLCLKKIENYQKKKQFRYQERNRESRIKYYRNLRELIKVYGSKSIVFIDESGFEEFEGCVCAWAKRGKKVYGERPGKRGKRENLVAARRKGKKDLIAPMLFMGSLNAEGFEGWLSLYLLPDLTSPSILIMDNAPIHRKTVIRLLVEEAGHQIIFLPKYSPDLNDIEHDFSALKRAKMYASPGTSLDEIIRAYCAV
jgi:putative transposase